MEIELIKGSRFNLSQETPDVKILSIILGWQVNQTRHNYDIDASVFMLGADGKVPNEKYFVFYNNLQSPDVSLKHYGNEHIEKDNRCQQKINIDLSKIALDIQEIVFVVTIHEAPIKNQDFSQIKNAFIKIYNEETRQPLFCYKLREDFSQETALEFGRFYQKDGQWRFKAVGDGYKSGLQSFVEQYIVENQHKEQQKPVEIKTHHVCETTSEPNSQPQLIDITKKANINLLKTKVDIVLKKKGIADIIARVALVLDISGSMINQYNSGAVQAFLERIVPVASRLDDDGKLDVWFFASKFKRTTSVTEKNVDGYIQRELGELKRTLLLFKMPSLMVDLGINNNESIVILDVIKKYTQEEPSKVPTLIVFLSDGGVIDEQGIKKAIVDAAKYPIFWQFVGLAGSNYGILEKLDNMTGRIIDNADFFHVDDLSKITDEELYTRLLNEFPNWIKKAKAKNILSAS